MTETHFENPNSLLRIVETRAPQSPSAPSSASAPSFDDHLSRAAQPASRSEIAQPERVDARLADRRQTESSEESSPRATDKPSDDADPRREEDSQVVANNESVESEDRAGPQQEPTSATPDKDEPSDDSTIEEGDTVIAQPSDVTQEIVPLTVDAAEVEATQVVDDTATTTTTTTAEEEAEGDRPGEAKSHDPTSKRQPVAQSSETVAASAEAASEGDAVHEVPIDAATSDKTGQAKQSDRNESTSSAGGASVASETPVVQEDSISKPAAVADGATASESERQPTSSGEQPRQVPTEQRHSQERQPGERASNTPQPNQQHGGDAALHAAPSAAVQPAPATAAGTPKQRARRDAPGHEGKDASPLQATRRGPGANNAPAPVFTVMDALPLSETPAFGNGDGGDSSDATTKTTGDTSPAPEARGPRRLATPLHRQVSQTPTEQNGPTAIERTRFVQRVTRAFQAIGDRGGPLRLRLSPPELGSLRLEVAVQQGVMTARIEAESPAARTMLLDNLSALRERLAEQDIKIERFDVDLMDQSPDGLPQTPQEDRQAAQQQRRAASNVRRGSVTEADRGRDDASPVLPDENGQLNVIV